MKSYDIFYKFPLSEKYPGQDFNLGYLVKQANALTTEQSRMTLVDIIP